MGTVILYTSVRRKISLYHQRIFNLYMSNDRFIPRSTYRKSIGDGIRTITYGAHTSSAASTKSSRFVTNVTEAASHQPCLTLCHRLATTMPRSFPYLSITVVLLTDGGELAPHKDIQKNRFHQNATTSFGEWEGGDLQVLVDDQWINQDSDRGWVFLNARKTYHRVTEVLGHSRLCSISSSTARGGLGAIATVRISRQIPVDAVWEQGISNTHGDSDSEEELPMTNHVSLESRLVIPDRFLWIQV